MALRTAPRLDPMESPRDLAADVLTTLRVADERGFALLLPDLAAVLHGGTAPVPAVEAAARATPGVVVRDGGACLEGRDRLLSEAISRRAAHERLAGAYGAIAEAYVRDLVAVCPWVRSVAVCGSFGSRAFAPGDDLDFNLLCDRGTKYLTYLTAVVLGIAYSARHRRAASPEGVTPVLRTPILHKLICINVVWPEEQTRPFARQDEQMAFELLISKPVYDAERFAEVVAANPRLAHHFPQLQATARREIAFPPIPGGSVPRRLPARILARLTARPLPRRALERLARGVAWVLYSTVQLYRRRDPRARARVAFLRRVKHPYDLFQEGRA